MQISLWVPYDEARLRRTIKIVLRPQMRPLRVLGGVCIALGLLLLAADGPWAVITLALVAGIGPLTVIEPISVSWTVAMQSAAIKDGYHMTLTDEWLSVAYPLVESRYRWAVVDKVVETPEAWYLLLGKAQSLTGPKDLLTEPQRAEVGAFLAATGQRRAFLQGRP
jgi:hypothetical protein